MGRPRGLSLLEVLLSMGLLSLVVFSVMTAYTGLLGGTTRADVNREAVATLDALCDLWEAKTRESWPLQKPPDPFVTVEGEFAGMVYRVDDYGRVENPDAAGTFLELKQIRVRVLFTEMARGGEPLARSYEAPVFVAK